MRFYSRNELLACEQTLVFSAYSNLKFNVWQGMRFYSRNELLACEQTLVFSALA